MLLTETETKTGLWSRTPIYIQTEGQQTRRFFVQSFNLPKGGWGVGETKLKRNRETETEYKQMLVYSNNMKTDITEKKYDSY